jgi:uncharacterized membrane protein YeaQ/YmgE (transglycosylase-associated protein family)
MQYVWMIIVGLITGQVARFIYPGAVPMGFIASTALGIGGSLLSGFIGNLIHKKPDGPAFARAGFIYSVLGSLLLIFVARNVLHLV